MTVLAFKPLAEQPHVVEYLRCSRCGHEGVHVYPERTPRFKLECRCRVVGALVVWQRPCAACGCQATQHPVSNAAIPPELSCVCGKCHGYKESE